MIMGVYLLGWLGSELTSRVAVIAGDISPWLERSERILKIAPQATAASLILRSNPWSAAQLGGDSENLSLHVIPASTPHGVLGSSRCVGGFLGRSL
jgi:hypothetical protein